MLRLIDYQQRFSANGEQLLDTMQNRRFVQPLDVKAKGIGHHPQQVITFNLSGDEFCY